MGELPWAPVERWNTRNVHVRCPYCGKLHRHGFNGSYQNQRRVPHCGTNASVRFPSYQFRFPFSTAANTTAYEIDKSNGYYTALSAEKIPIIKESLDDAFERLRVSADQQAPTLSWSSATEQITIPLEDDDMFRGIHQYFGGEDTYDMGRLDHVAMRMLGRGDHDYVEKFLHESTEAELLLLGTDETSDTALTMAACEKYPKVVELLLREGANVDHQNKAGRSALMEAALWGRIENVRHLLKHGANPKLRDKDGRQALELADRSDRNEEERFNRSGGEHQVHREPTFLANQQRRVISELLNQPEAPLQEVATAPDRTFESHMFRATGRGTIQLLAPVAEFPVRTQWKTIATLHRQGGYPAVAAMSGWGHNESQVTVSGNDWTEEVMRISAMVGHQLISDRRDQDVEGKFYASHAEKQLIAYFIDKHVLIKSQDDAILLDVVPPVQLKAVTILVSRPVCADCLRFIKTVNVAFGLDIVVLYRS